MVNLTNEEHQYLCDMAKRAAQLEQERDYQTRRAASLQLTLNTINAEREELKAMVSAFTGRILIHEYPDDPETGENATVTIINGKAQSASTAWSMLKFKSQIERRFPAPKNCAWAFYVCTAQIVRVQA